MPWVIQPGIHRPSCFGHDYGIPTLTNDDAELLAEVTAERDELRILSARVVRAYHANHLIPADGCHCIENIVTVLSEMGLLAGDS